MKQFSRSLLVVFVCVLVSGCSSSSVRRTTPDRERPMTTQWEADDLRMVVEKMVDSMLAFPPVLELIAAARPVLDVAQIKNRTMQHIDTVAITDSVRTKLLRSGKFRFKDRSTAGTDVDFIGEENESGLVDSSKAVKPGKQLATEFYLYGTIMEIRNRSGRTVDQYYKITLSLKDLAKGELVWTDEQEIRKEKRRKLIGS